MLLRRDDLGRAVPGAVGGSRGGRVRLDRCAGLSTFRTLAARRRQRRRPVASGSRAALPHRGLVGSALWRSVLRSPVELDRHLRGTGPMADPGCGGGRLLRGHRRAADSRPATAGGAALDRRCLGAHRSRAGPRTVRRLSVGAARVQPGRVAAAVVRRARRRSPRHVRGGNGRRRAGARNPGATARPPLLACRRGRRRLPARCSTAWCRPGLAASAATGQLRPHRDHRPCSGKRAGRRPGIRRSPPPSSRQSRDADVGTGPIA